MTDDIQAFLDVAHAGSFSAAAKARDLAVSSVSRRIDALEAALGVKLFHRSSRRLLLTDAGELFMPRAQAILHELDEAKSALLDAHAEPQGVLTVTVPATFGRRHVSPALTTFLQQYPRIEV